MIRAIHAFARSLAIAVLIVAAASSPARADTAFDKFLQSLWPEVQELGVSRPIFDAATRGLEPDLSLPDLVIPGEADTAPQQPEFVQTPADYVRENYVARLATQGKKLLDTHRATLDAIERQFGVQPSVILGDLGPRNRLWRL